MRRHTTWTAATIRRLRGRLGLTQTDFAVLVGTRQGTVSQWETGLAAPMRVFRAKLDEVASKRAGVAR